MYFKLLKLIKSISQELQQNFLFGTRKQEVSNIPNSFFVLTLEISKGIDLFCAAIEMQAFSQAASLLRQLLEQVAVIRVLEKYPNCREEYKHFCKLRLGVYQGDKNKEIELNNLYNQLNDKKLKRGKEKFIELGWLMSINNDYGIEILFQLSEINDLTKWRKFLNNFVHSNIFAIQLINIESYVEDFIYISAIICDILMCSYHNITGYFFDTNINSNREKFATLFNEITLIRAKK